MPRSAPPKACCLVVGMHNSGTSLVGALLHAAGVPMGERLLLREAIAAEKRPRYDYFEDEDVVALQDATLLELQRHWSSYRGAFPLPPADSAARQSFRRQLGDLLQQRLKREHLWVVKDPRTAALLDDWLTVLQELQVQARLLIVHRDAASNIRSFSSKGQLPALWAEALWQRTYTNALRAAESLPAAQVQRVSFAQLMADPEAEARQICGFLNWTPNRDLAAQVAARFDPALPTQSAAASSASGLHGSTLELQQQLMQPEARAPEEQQLLAAELAEVLIHHHDPLNLNGLHRNGQSLLPKLRVMIVTAELQGWGPSGGIGSAYRELAEALQAAGHPVRVLLVCAGDPPGEAPAPGLQVERLDPSGLTRLELCRRVAERLQPDPGDVIHLHDWLGLGSGLRAALGADAPPLIVGLHGPSAWARSGNPWPEGVAPEPLYEEGLVRALEQDTLAQADLLVAPSRFMANWVEQHLPLQQPVVVQRNCPLSRGRITAGPETQAARLVYFGRLEQRKGLLLFLEALEQLSEAPAEVVFVGGDCRIAEEHWGSELVQERLERRGIRFRIETGLERDQALQRLHELAGVVVIPSLIENSPCVVEELLNSGLRLVTTGVGGTPELVSAASQPWLSAPEPAALAGHLAQALQPVEPGAYQLQAGIPAWQIALSWQAFHERLPRRQAQPTEAPASEQAPTNRVRRSLRLAKRVARQLMNLARNR